MRRSTALTLVLLLAWAGWLGAQQAPKKTSKVRCTLTNRVVEKCCCEYREGKIYCPLAKKTVESCCCVPAEEGKKKAAPKK
jgi:hypothetical protein